MRCGLRVKSIDTCRSEHKGLKDVREGNDAPWVLVLIHQNQAMDLWVQEEHHRQVRLGAGVVGWCWCKAPQLLTCSLAMRSMMSSMVSWG